MGFRTLEITGPAELHVRMGSLVIEKEKTDLQTHSEKTISDSISSGQEKKDSKKGRTRKSVRSAKEMIKLSIPLEDVNTIVCMGADLRISTMAMAKICDHGISMMMLDEKYRPAGILTSYESNARQSLVMRKQVYMDDDRTDRLWSMIVRQKILNQAAALRILELPGADSVAAYEEKVYAEREIDAVEAGAAKTYFQYLCPGINRREDSPINSRLNYGYSILRNSIIRAILAAGMLPSFGLHHQNLYNMYNLADDLIEPFRPCVDLIAWQMEGDDCRLSREERRQLTQVLQHAVRYKEKKIPVLSAIDQVVHGVRSYIAEENSDLPLPSVIPAEIIEPVRE